MESKPNNRNIDKNHKKRKFSAVNDNTSSQSSKRRKLNSMRYTVPGLQNIFDKEKALKKEINILKQERDGFKNQMSIYKKDLEKYKQLYLQMNTIIKQCQTQNQSNIQNNITRNINNYNKNTNTQSSVPLLKTNYYCKKCDRYFKNGKALGGHNSAKHTQYNGNNYNKNANSQNKNSFENFINAHTFNINTNNTEQRSHASKSKLVSNNAIKNLRNDSNASIPQLETNYYCRECNEYFKNPQALGYHNSIKHTQKEHKCSYCERIFASGNALGGHMKTHNKSKSKSINNNNKSELETMNVTRYYCNKCDRYFKNGMALGGHNSRKHTRSNGIHKCSCCSKRFYTVNELDNHMKIHTKLESNELEGKNWNNCHFISVNCKLCNKHFDNFEEYCNHLENEFKNDINKRWLYCNELNCNGTKKYNKYEFISHLTTHGYGRPFHCNLKYSSAQRKCKYSSAQKSGLMTHLDIIHKISLKSQKPKRG